MTQLREQAIEMIKEIPEDKQILMEKLEQYRGRLPKDFDYKKELEEARDEKYADFT